MSNVVFGVAFPVVGAFLSNVMFSSSLLVIRLSRRQRFLSKSVNPIPWAMSMVTVFAWQVYGVLVGDLYLISANIFGLFVTTFSTTSAIALLAVSRDPQEWKYIGYMESIIMVSIFVWVVFSYIIVSTGDYGLAVQLIGMYAVICSILMYVSPLATLFTVVTLKDASSIYVPQAIANGLNSTCWLIYGFFGVNSPTVYIPSLLGVFSCLILVTFKMIFPSKVVTEIAAVPTAEEKLAISVEDDTTEEVSGRVRKGSASERRRAESNASSRLGGSSTGTGNSGYLGQIALSARVTGGVRQRVGSNVGSSAHSGGGGSHGEADPRARAFSYHRSGLAGRERRDSQASGEPATRGRTATIKYAIAPDAPPTIAEIVSQQFDRTVEAVRVRAESILQVVETSILATAAPVLRDEVIEAAANLQELQIYEEQQEADGAGSVHSSNQEMQSLDNAVQRVGVFATQSPIPVAGGLSRIPETPVSGVQPMDRFSTIRESDAEAEVEEEEGNNAV